MEAWMEKRPVVRAACMVSATVALAICATFVDPMPTQYYKTGSGERRTIDCANSSITLDTQSWMSVQCTRNLLRVRLFSGGASFRIGQDPSKSTLVRAGDAEIYDTGSVFAVERNQQRTTIKVVEGLVQMSVTDPGPLGAAQLVWEGERATVFDSDTEVRSRGTVVLISREATATTHPGESARRTSARIVAIGFGNGPPPL